MIKTINEHPQSDALKLLEKFYDPKLKAIGNYGCCALVALWIMGITGSVESICLVAGQIGKSLDADCTVYWQKFFKEISGRNISVEFRDIKKLYELKDVEYCAVRFDYNGKSHWVGVSHGEVVYNPLSYSVCVDKGKPATARIIHFN